jgi:N-acetyl-anhydromuramyl-L-alanine amidase AmpD
MWKENVINIPASQYFKEETAKKQIVLHHTVSGPGSRGDIGTWLQDAARIATPYIVGRNGDRDMLFDPRYWAWHLGCNDHRNKSLNMGSIGIELDSYGPLTHVNGKYYNAYGGIVNGAYVIKLPSPFRGFEYFEAYTVEQVESTVDLLKELSGRFGIPMVYNDDMWGYSERAMNGEPGVWAHVSFREDKSDAYPDPYLIKKLKSFA